MKDFVIGIVDEGARKKDYLVLSEQDLSEILREAGRNPVSPLIVRRMERRAFEKSYTLTGLKSELFRVARDILLGKQRSFSLAGRILGQNSPAAFEPPPPAALTPVVSPPASPLSLVFYDNHVEDLERLVDAIGEQNHVALVWSPSRGFLLDRLSTNYLLFEGTMTSRLRDPIEVLRFIIEKPQTRVSFVFEDFHHFIGKEGAVHPEIGEIRSLIKDLHRVMGERDERVYFFVPSSYEPPLELKPFWAMSAKTKTEAKGFLELYGRNLTDEDYLRHAKPVVGMSAIIDRVIQILTQMEVCNPLLVGHPGVGKTAVVDGLALAMVNNRVPGALKGRMLYSLSLNSLVAGTRYRGDFEERIKQLMDEVRQSQGKIIVFIDEIHTLVEAGAAEGAMGAGEILKASLARGEFPCIGATTLTGAGYFGKDPALSRRFRKIVVVEPTMEEALAILKGVAPSFEKHHGLKIEDAALKAAVELSAKHLHDEYLPGKAIALVDAAAAYCGMKGQERVAELDIWMEIKRMQRM